MWPLPGITSPEADSTLREARRDPEPHLWPWVASGVLKEFQDGCLPSLHSTRLQAL